MIYVLLFSLVVAVIGIVTHKLNAKIPCDHAWLEHEHTVRCSKCNKCIPKYNTATTSTYSEAA